MSYRTTVAADQDIVDIYLSGIELFGVAQAEAYAEGIFHCFTLLAQNPRMARERHDITPPVRLFPFKAHLIVYVAGQTDILIVRVLHGRQQWLDLLS